MLPLIILLPFEWSSITPSDILTSLIAPILLFLAGTFIERSRRKYDERKQVKKECVLLEKEQFELKVLRENILGWVQRINEKILVQISKLDEINTNVRKVGQDKLDLDVVPIPVERLLSYSDLDIRKIIIDTKHYLDVISGISFVKEVERDLQKLFSNFESESTVLERRRLQLNSEGYEIVFNLENSPQSSKYLEILRISLLPYMNQNDVENFDPTSFYSFLDKILAVIDKQIKFKNVTPEATINSFFEFYDKYENYINEISFLQTDFLERINFILANLKLIESYNSSFLKSVVS